MCEILCLAGYLLAQLFGGGATTDVPDGGVVISGSRVFTVETRTGSGPRYFARVPYVNRLFRSVGYTRAEWSLGTALVGAAAAHEEMNVPAPAEFPQEVDPREGALKDVVSGAATQIAPAEVRAVRIGLDAPLPILPPIKVGETPRCDDAPTDAEVLRALPRLKSVLYFYQAYREDIEITMEKLVDKVDPQRFFPLIGPAQLHHCHWKCTVYFTESIEATYPFVFKAKRRQVEVVYIDKDRLHLCVNGFDAQRETFLEMTCPAGQSVPVAGGGGAKRNVREKMTPESNTCPFARMEQLLIDVESLRPIHDEYKKFWMNDQPTHSKQRIRACWEPRVHMLNDVVNSAMVPVLKGSVYLLDCETSKTVDANGSILVEAFDHRAQKFAQWHIDAASLAKWRRTDMIGVGYTLCLPVDGWTISSDEIKLKVTYRPQRGTACTEESEGLVLNARAEPFVVLGGCIGPISGAVAPHVVPAQHTEPRRLADSIQAKHDVKAATQVQLEVVIAHVNTGAVDSLKLELNDNRDARFGLVRDWNGVTSTLQALRKDGAAKIMAEPRIITLSGRPASILNGSEMPILTPSGTGAPNITYKQFGTVLNLLPIVTDDGRIQLEARLELSTPERRTADGFATRTANVAVKMEAGKTLAIVTPGTDRRKKQDVVIFVTPRLAEPAADLAITNSPVLTPRSAKMTLTQVVEMCKRGIAEDIVIRQMELTESTFKLTVDDIIYLHDHGVTTGVIRWMQDSQTPRPAPAPSQPTPHRIHGGVGPASSSL